MNNKMIFLIIGAMAIAGLWLNRQRVRKNLDAMPLSKNFKLSEFVVTQTGIDNIPSDFELANILDLVDYILQPLRDAFGLPVRITSGYRSALVNAAIGGAKTSQHLTGSAADITISGISNQQIINKVRELHLPYDQLIDENVNGKQWVHVSFAQTGRREWMTARTDPQTGKTVYRLISLT